MGKPKCRSSLRSACLVPGGHHSSITRPGTYMTCTGENTPSVRCSPPTLSCIVLLDGTRRDNRRNHEPDPCPVGVAHYYQRLAELSTLPFWQLPDFGEPSGPERGHVWHWQDIYPELARSRDIRTARPSCSAAR